MTIETEVAALATSVNVLTGQVNTSLSTLTNSATNAATSATNAETHKNSTSTLKTETGALKDLAVTAAGNAATAAASAYQDLAALAQSKSETAVDIFVYDTSKDSDGGAWRNRTQGTSWYNEPLNTSTRGATKKFPAVAVIFITTGQLRIYDGDSPTLPLWMMFDSDQHAHDIPIRVANSSNGRTTSVTAKDGKVFVTATSDASHGNLTIIDFVKDGATLHSGGGWSFTFTVNATIAERNGNSITNTFVAGGGTLVDANVNDVAVTVLPNAPIDPDTGLPVPTIAVATNGGVSVIKDDGSVANLTRSGGQKHVGFVGEHLTATRSHTVDVFNKVSDLPSGTYSDVTVRLKYFDSGQVPSIHRWATGVNDLVVGENLTVGSNIALSSLALNHKDYSKSMVNYITSSFNTGWMNGDIKLATLMDTTAETISNANQVQDRSVNNNGLNIVGNVTKSAVATGAELVSYEGGSGTYLEQSYNADLNFGYGDYCVMFWAKQISGDLTAVFRGDSSAGATGGAGAMNIWLNGNKLKTIIDGASQQIDTPKGNDSFAHYVVTRRNGTVYFYQDGVLFHTYNATTKNVSRTEGTRVLSGYYPHNNTANKLALLRISATAPTAEQIAKIYRDENPLFQEGAKCTLYGNSDVVNAIDYDDATGTLYVGTTNSNGTGGLSEFTGLQRTGLNSNTTSVGYAVSAQNGLVVSE